MDLDVAAVEVAAPALRARQWAGDRDREEIVVARLAAVFDDRLESTRLGLTLPPDRPAEGCLLPGQLVRFVRRAISRCDRLHDQRQHPEGVVGRLRSRMAVELELARHR